MRVERARRLVIGAGDRSVVLLPPPQQQAPIGSGAGVELVQSAVWDRQGDRRVTHRTRGGDDPGLDRAGELFAPLKKVFNEQATLQEVIKIPLMLRFLLSIDPKPIVQELSQANVQELSQQATRLKSQIVECYIQENANIFLNYKK